MQARLRHEALREQQNIENVVVGAFENIQPDVSAENVDDDWIAEPNMCARYRTPKCKLSGQVCLHLRLGARIIFSEIT
jgi:hypothetical protein